ncbi:unnamed protein product [Albugo candida]|uniref:Gamma tubulin complex component C-terminal domain-containing protein n=1 Tax=Albugo candida TaxID=65357 RepID=A0A024GC39_9STRA|nr:unnamed protein product [Albugo candida]|eukprot:CCI44115.1 unnamed protein product [Albugo candida]
MGDRNNDARLLDLDTSNCEQYKVSDLLIKLRDKMLHQQNTKSAFSDIIYLYEKILTHRSMRSTENDYEFMISLQRCYRKLKENPSRTFCNALEHGKSAENLAFILPDIFARERISDDIQLQDPIKLLVALNGSIDGSSEPTQSSEMFTSQNNETTFYHHNDFIQTSFRPRSPCGGICNIGEEKERDRIWNVSNGNGTNYFYRQASSIKTEEDIEFGGHKQSFIDFFQNFASRKAHKTKTSFKQDQKETYKLGSQRMLEEIADDKDAVFDESNWKIERGWENWSGSANATQSANLNFGSNAGDELMRLDLKLSDCSISDLLPDSQDVLLGDQDIVEEMIKALSGVESVLLRRNLTSATFELPSYRIKVLTGSNKSITSALEDIRTTATNVFRLDLLALFLVQNPEKMGKTAIELGRCIRSYLRAYQSKLKTILQQNEPTLSGILFYTKSIRAQIQYIAGLFQCDGSEFWCLLHGMFPRGAEILNCLHTELINLERTNGSWRQLSLVTWLMKNTIKPYLELLWEIISNGTIASTSDPHDEFLISTWSREYLNAESSKTFNSTFLSTPDSGIRQNLFPNILTAKLASDIIFLSKAHHLLPPAFRITRFLQTSLFELPLIDIDSSWRARQQHMQALAELNKMNHEDHLSKHMQYGKIEEPEVRCDSGPARSAGHKRALSFSHQTTLSTKRQRHHKQCERNSQHNASHQGNANMQPNGLEMASMDAIRSDCTETIVAEKTDQDDAVGNVVPSPENSASADITSTTSDALQVGALSALSSVDMKSILQFNEELVSDSNIVIDTISLPSVTREETSKFENSLPTFDLTTSKGKAKSSPSAGMEKPSSSEEKTMHSNQIDIGDKENQPFVSKEYHHFHLLGMSSEDKANPRYFFHMKSDVEEERVLESILDQSAAPTYLMPSELFVDSFVGWTVAKLRDFTEIDIVKFILETMNLRKHLEWLHKFMLMSESLCMELLTQDIYTRLFSSSRGISMLDRSLNLMLQVALMETNLNDEDMTKCFSYSVDIAARALFENPTALTVAEIVSKIQLSYEPLWPLHLIITPSSMRTYNKIHQFLLHLKLTKHQLEDVGRHVRRISPHLNNAADTKALRHLEIVMYKISHILSAVHAFFVTNVLLLKARRLYQTISTFKELKLICQAHELFVHDVSESCFLGPCTNSIKIHSKLLRIFDFAWRLSSMKTAATLHLDYNMAEMHQSLNSASRDLIQTLQSVDNNENSTINNAAQELLVRFDLTLTHQAT